MSTTVQPTVSAYRYFFPPPAQHNPYYQPPHSVLKARAKPSSTKEADLMCPRKICTSKTQGGCQCSYVEALEMRLGVPVKAEERSIDPAAFAVDLLVRSCFPLSIQPANSLTC